MARSFAQEANLVCPTCRQVFTAEIWLIVDVGERADLAERIRGDTINTVSCPHCGDKRNADAPLLIHNAERRQVSFISPQGTSQEEDRYIAGQLVRQLAETFLFPRPDYLGRVMNVPRDLLPTILCADASQTTVEETAVEDRSPIEKQSYSVPKARRQSEPRPSEAIGTQQLLETVIEFVLADNWLTRWRIAEQHPELFTDETDLMLRRLRAVAREEGDHHAARVYEGRRTLLRRYLSISDEARAALIKLTERAQTAGISSPGELAELADTHPELQPALAALPGGNPVIPSDIRPLMEEILRLDDISDMPSRAELCQRAIERISCHDYPGLWGALQGLLADSLIQDPNGEHAENLEQAIEIYQQALEVMIQGGVPANQTIVTVNSLASAYSKRAHRERGENLERMIECYQQVLEVWSKEEEPLEWADAMNSLANIYSEHYYGSPSENLEQAIAMYQQVLEVVTRDDMPELWISTMTNLALAYSNRILDNDAENLERAIVCYQQVLEALTREEKPEEWATVMVNLASAYAKRTRGEWRENRERAIAHFRAALEVLTRDAMPLEWAMLMTNLATAYSDRMSGDRMQNLEQAIAYCEAALEVRTPETDLAGWVSTMNTLASRYRERIRGPRSENLDQAIKYYRTVLETVTRKEMPVEWAMAMTNLATVYSDRVHGDRAENLEQAITHYQQVLDVVEALPVGRALVEYNLATAYFERIRGDRVENLDQAIVHYQAALQVRTRENMPLEWVETMNGLASAYAGRLPFLSGSEREKDMRQALSMYQEALEVLTPKATPREYCLVQSNLGHLYLGEAYWDGVVDAYRGTLDAFELLYQAAATLEARQTELRAARGISARLAYALAQIAQGQHSAALTEAAMVIERNRARWLSEALTLQGEKPPTVPRNVWEVFLTHRETVQRLQKEARLPEDTPAKKSFLELSEAFGAARDALSEAIAEIRRHDKSFMPAPTFAQIRATVVPGYPVVYLVVAPTGTLGLVISVQFCDDSESSQSLVYPVWSDLTEEELGELLVQRNGDWVSGYLPAQFGDASMDVVLGEILPMLGDRLIGPLAKKLREVGAKGVVLIPGGLLGLLPLHAARYLRDGKETCLLDEFDVAYAPSARALRAAQRALAKQEGTTPVLAGVGNPLENPKPLRYARAELGETATFFPDASRHVLYEREATKEALVAALPGATYVHLSCHGLFDPEEPLDSHLQLADEERFTLREVMGSDYLDSTRLAVLSACQTAITDFNNLPDEVIGLPTGFLQAGVPGVVGTLWSVNDLSTALLMVKFYEYHLRGDLVEAEGPMPPARALCRAQRWLRDVTAGELLDYFQRHQALHQARREVEQQRMSEEVAAAGVIRFAMEDPDSRPFADSPYHWAPFVFLGV